MKGQGLGSKNMLFIFRFSCLFTFRHHKQLSIVAWFLKRRWRLGSNGRSQRTLLFNRLFICCLFFVFRVCLYFVKVNNVCWHFDKTLKGHQYGYQMKDLGLGSKNMLFIFRFSCLFTFRHHKQLPIVARFFKGYASLEQWEVAADPSFLTVCSE
jgi:hypothetical protein